MGYAIGLTGSIAAGKSAVARILAELGAKVVDSDEVVHRLQEPGQPAWLDIVREFGQAILNPDQTINRQRLGEIAFGDPEALKRLNRATHPHVIAEIDKMIFAAKRPESSVVLVVEGRVLIEAGVADHFDEIWYVDVAPEVQIERLMERSHLSRAAALQRIAAEMDPAQKKRYATNVIDNSRSLYETRRQVESLWHEVAP